MATEKRKGTGKAGKRRDRVYLIVAASGKLVLVSESTGKVTEVDGKNAARVLKLLKNRQKITTEIAEVLEDSTLGEVEMFIIDPNNPVKPKGK